MGGDPWLEWVQMMPISPGKPFQACINLLGRNPEVRHLSAMSREVAGVRRGFGKGSNARARHGQLSLRNSSGGVLGEFSLLGRRFRLMQPVPRAGLWPGTLKCPQCGPSWTAARSCVHRGTLAHVELVFSGYLKHPLKQDVPVKQTKQLQISQILFAFRQS